MKQKDEEVEYTGISGLTQPPNAALKATRHHNLLTHCPCRILTRTKPGASNVELPHAYPLGGKQYGNLKIEILSRLSEATLAPILAWIGFTRSLISVTS